MIFSRKEHLGMYPERLNVFKAKLDYEGWLSHYLKNEPHSLYNMGHVLDFIKKSHSDSKVLSIGIDPIKETILIRESKFCQIDVYDIDAEAVKVGNKYWENSDLNIQYYIKNLLQDEVDVNYDTALLFQMDYIFSDWELSLILKRLKQSGISDCYVITPSLFNINLNLTTRPDIIFYDTLHLFLYLLNSLKLRIKQKTALKLEQSSLITFYKRTKNHLIKLFTKQNFIMVSQKCYLNNNGSFNLFHFKLETTE